MFEYNIGLILNDLVDQAVEIFGYDVEPTEEEVWEIARTFEEAPSFTNIFLEMFFEKLAEEFWKLDKSLEFDWSINGNASYINYRFNTSDDFNALTDIDLYDFLNRIKNNAII
ncbi:hypothetical protein [Peptoniphilus timonensis]|uniref:hypothetical protein n=1 Tax=Peptoniphilus timonensis TaxID=1268254 RepID=UPI0002ED9754|nr:hypothetical protein [Peptoniphilus timonensis]